MTDEFSFEKFGHDLHRFVSWALSEAGEKEESSFARLLREHFGADPSDYPLTRESFATYDEPNLQLAVDAYLAAPGREHELVGFAGAHEMMDISLAALVGGESRHLYVSTGPVQRATIELDDGRQLTCVTSGFYMVSEGEERLAFRLGRRQEHMGGGSGIDVEVMTPVPEAGEAFIAELRRLMAEHNVYRGKMLALEGGDHGPYGAMSVKFLRRPGTARGEIILPEALLDTIDLNTIKFASVRDELVRAGMHLRRGLLLHGPPGTGKTLTTGYIASELRERTVIVLTGSALGLISTACAMARDLEPAMVILEDIDLVASERTMIGIGGGSLLFELLNEMDGIGEDADVIFLMTTNRADLLEPALAGRPGRVDQAVELPLPDDAGRARLLDLYCRGLDISLDNRDDLVARTEGASAAFMRELVRKATVQATVDSRTVVEGRDFDAALRGLEQGGSLTRRILGAEGAGEAGETGAEEGGYLEWEE